ncbi:site-specific DNA recombinase [Kitasatospora sp. MAA19]|uniref:recombinase family protein n=1 Tax=Kitasatospora sp. MAA19 TaxID=3035090 RepID=UPI002474D88B|nr:recombinase family protein [Kitasatospora sp. MAA19]MDH6705378.1 site-specific DNA recombinase [Kitasatospora sp. MAA19]
MPEDQLRRVLLAKRISDDKGETSESVADQDRKLRARAHEEGAIIAGHPEDLSVSGDVDPFHRPKLGPWLQEHNLDRWDELWVTTQDRLSRSEPHVMALVFEVLKWGKLIVVLDDPEFTRQMQTPEGRAILHVKSLGPHKELERIKQRVQDSHDRRRYTTRWPGGIAPFGYKIVHRFEEGRTAAFLELEETAVAELHQMRSQMINDRKVTFSKIAQRLNTEGVLTARDRARVAKGKPVKARGGEPGTREQWSETSIRLLLTDEACLGYKKYRKEVIHDAQGNPIVMAPAIFTQEEWSTLQAAVGRRRNTTERRVNATAPMYGVAYCENCESKAVHKVTHKTTKAGGETQYRYYQCGAWPKEKRCRGYTCRAEIVEEMVEIHFLQQYGHTEVTKRVWMPGSDSSQELAEVIKRTDRLRRQDEEGDWDKDRAGYRSRMDGYKARRTHLEAMPHVPAGWVEQGQGLTYLEQWSQLDQDGRRQQLIDSGFRMLIGQQTVRLAKAPLPQA